MPDPWRRAVTRAAVASAMTLVDLDREPSPKSMPPLTLADLDGLATGLARVGPDGRVLACNAAFGALAGDQADACWTPRADWPARKGAPPPSLWRMRTPAGRSLIAHKLPLGDANDEWLLALRPGDRVTVSAERLSELWGLAPREAEIAALLVEGLDIKSVARRLDIAVSTARVHLRNIFRKTGTARQTALLIALVTAATM
jgi:DNA-binding CsgD family transcriptional regulator